MYGVSEVYENLNKLKIGMSTNFKSMINMSGLQLLLDTIERYLQPDESTYLVEVGGELNQIGLSLASVIISFFVYFYNI